MTTTAPIPARLNVPRRATVADWLALPEERGAELLHGRIVQKALPAPDHSLTQAKLAEILGPFNRRPRDANRPGGWWIVTQCDLLLAGEGVRPDLAGWRRERVPTLPKPAPGSAVAERPDWIAEVLSPSTAHRDLSDKLMIYHAAEVPHYWIADPTNRTLMVYRRLPEGYMLVLGAGADKTVRVEPFEAIELDVGMLFGVEKDEEATESSAP